MPVVDVPSQNKPTAARIEHANNNPSGDIFSTIGPAKNLSTNMIPDVYTSTRIPFIPAMFVIRLAIQLSVPSSTYPTSACNTSIASNTGWANSLSVVAKGTPAAFASDTG